MSSIKIKSDSDRQVFSREDIAEIIAAINEALPPPTLRERIAARLWRLWRWLT